MATSAVDIVVKVAGSNRLDALDRKLKGLDATVDKAGGSIGGLSSKLAKFAKPAAAIAAVVAVGVAVQKTAAKFAAFADDLNRSRQALASIAGAETPQAIRAIDDTIEKFGGTVQEATKNFTGLQAAVQANGLTVSETEKVFKGLTAANRALGGSSEDLNGILLAAQQVFSKGKVSAEELRGQIGERLPGAFAEFAKATGRSTAQLDKALQDGEVSIDEFVLFAEGLFEKYEEDAEALYRGPNNATERLKDGLNKFNTQLGILLKPINDAFNALFSGILKLASQFIRQLNNVFGLGAEGALNKAERDFAAAIKTRDRLAAAAENQAGGGKRTQQNLARAEARVKKLGAALAELKRQANPEIQGLKPTPLPEFDLGGGDGKSTKTPRTPRPARQQTLQEALGTDYIDVLNTRVQQAQLANQQLYNEALKDGNKELAEQLRQQKELIPINEEIAALVDFRDKIQNGDLSKQYPADQVAEQLAKIDKQLESAFNERDIAQAEATTKALEKEEAIATARENALRPLEEQKRILEATLNGKGEQVRLEIEAENIASRVEGLSKEEVLTQLQKNAALQKEVDLAEQLKAAYTQLATNIAGELTGALGDVIKQTKSVEEAFADMLTNIGNMFIDMAMQILQSAITKQLINLFSNLAGGGTPMGFGLPLNGFADGGRPEVGQYSLVGEKGPELVRFDQPATVYSNDDSQRMADAMLKYSSNRSESGLTGGNSGADEFGEGQSLAPTVRVDYGVTRINDMNFVTEEEFQAGLNRATQEGAAQGARAGEARVYGRLKGQC